MVWKQQFVVCNRSKTPLFLCLYVQMYMKCLATLLVQLNWRSFGMLKHCVVIFYVIYKYLLTRIVSTVIVHWRTPFADCTALSCCACIRPYPAIIYRWYEGGTLARNVFLSRMFRWFYQRAKTNASIRPVFTFPLSKIRIITINCIIKGWL